MTGRAIDLVMLMANRQQIVGTLSGPGVADLADVADVAGVADLADVAA